MTEEEAYGSRTYCQRVNTWYKAGDKVTIGPAFRMGGQYTSDGCEGNYTVFHKLDSMGDYILIRGDEVIEGEEGDLMVHASRMTRR